MSLIKSTARHLQKRTTIAILVPIFFTLTGLHLSSIFLRATKTWDSHDSYYGLSAAYRSVAAFVSHPYVLFKRISTRSMRFEEKRHGKSIRKLDGQKHWKAAVRTQRKLRHNVARPVDDDPFDVENENAPSRGEYLITYYKPQLLPQYREPRQTNADALELVIPPKVFIAWYALVYPNKVQPTAPRALKLLSRYSTRDRREILRITQLAKHQGVGEPRRDGTYKDMWKKYLKNKGPDIVVCFAS